MKLTHEELSRAKEYQLAAVGMVRQGNSGWMAQALQRDFTEEEIVAFRAVRVRAHKTSQPFCGKKRLRKAGHGTEDLFA